MSTINNFLQATFPLKFVCVFLSLIIRSKDEDINLVSPDVFYKEAPPEIAKPVSGDLFVKEAKLYKKVVQFKFKWHY